MNQAIKLAALMAVGVSGAGAAHAQVAVGGSIGTTGAAVEAQVQVLPGLHVRGGYNFFQYEADDVYDDIAYAGDLDLNTIGGFVDFHPFGNSFMITGGAYFGEKTLDLAATPASNVEIGSQTFTPAEVGTLGMAADLEDLAPFVGIGWDNTFENPGFSFKFIVGAMFTGSPQVDLTATGGTLANDSNFQAQLAQEEQILQDEINEYEIYPVVQAGLTFSF